jgi:hypothetical protein
MPSFADQLEQLQHESTASVLKDQSGVDVAPHNSEHGSASPGENHLVGHEEQLDQDTMPPRPYSERDSSNPQPTAPPDADAAPSPLPVPGAQAAAELGHRQQPVNAQPPEIIYQRFAQTVYEFDREGLAYFGQNGSKINELSENTPARESAKLLLPTVYRQRRREAGVSNRWGGHLRDIPFIPQELGIGPWRLETMAPWLLHDLRQHGVRIDDLLDRAPSDLRPDLDERSFRLKFRRHFINKYVTWAMYRGGLVTIAKSGKLPKLPEAVLNGINDRRGHRQALTPEQYLFDVTWTLNLENGMMYPPWNEEQVFRIPPPLMVPNTELMGNALVRNRTILGSTQIDRAWLAGQYPHLPQPRDNIPQPLSQFMNGRTQVSSIGAGSHNRPTASAPPPARPPLDPSTPAWRPQVLPPGSHSNAQPSFPQYARGNFQHPVPNFIRPDETSSNVPYWRRLDAYGGQAQPQIPVQPWNAYQRYMNEEVNTYVSGLAGAQGPTNNPSSFYGKYTKQPDIQQDPSSYMPPVPQSPIVPSNDNGRQAFVPRRNDNVEEEEAGDGFGAAFGSHQANQQPRRRCRRS